MDMQVYRVLMRQRQYFGHVDNDYSNTTPEMNFLLAKEQ